MYLTAIVALMLVLPLVSVGIQVELHSVAPLPFIAARWFVFWAVGVRLLLAGVRQIAQPRFTAQQILGINAPEALLLVRELGFANVAMGSVATASVHFPQWVLPMGIVGTVFYGLAGISHARAQHRNPLQTIALVSDLVAALVLLILCLMQFSA